MSGRSRDGEIGPLCAFAASTFETLLQRVRATLSDLVDLQIVALIGPPLTGREGADNRALLRDALDAGVDVVGGCPQFDPDQARPPA